MALGEFELIERFFARPPRRSDVLLGVGDDCALVQPPPTTVLAITTDTLVADVHFYRDADPENIGHKTLAVNLSDLAAMGARPAWVTLSLTLPDVDEAWLAAFCRGFDALAQRFAVEIIGGDTTKGPLTLGVQACGFVAPGRALTRAGARPGDVIYLTGTTGDAGLGLAWAKDPTRANDPLAPYLRQRLERPEPRVAEGQALVGIASAAIDVSDGLAQDLGHLLKASGVGATVEIHRLPRSAALANLPAGDAHRLALTAGDDYELCFTVPPPREAALAAACRQWSVPCTAIGRIEALPDLRLVDATGRTALGQIAGYRHFQGSEPP